MYKILGILHKIRSRDYLTITIENTQTDTF